MRLHTRAFAIASAIVAATVYLLGAIIHVALPWGAPAVVTYIFRVDVIELARPISVDGLVVGILMFAVCGGFFGGLTAWVYNRFAKPGP
ncbi:MAG: DUF5676 family membrane protein [Gemmatimonadota bacterium]